MSDWRNKPRASSEAHSTRPEKSAKSKPQSGWRSRGRPATERGVGAPDRSWNRREEQPTNFSWLSSRWVILAFLSASICIGSIFFIRQIFVRPAKIPLISLTVEDEIANFGKAVPIDIPKAESFSKKPPISFLDFSRRGFEWDKPLLSTRGTLKGGGFKNQVVAFYVCACFVRFEDDVLFCHADPFTGSVQKAGITAMDLLKRIAEAIDEDCLAIVALDIQHPCVVANVSDSNFPKRELKRAFDDLEPSLQKRLVVILPCEEGQENLLEPGGECTIFARNFFDGLASLFSNNSTTVEGMKDWMQNEVETHTAKSLQCEQRPCCFAHDDVLKRHLFDRLTAASNTRMAKADSKEFVRLRIDPQKREITGNWSPISHSQFESKQVFQRYLSARVNGGDRRGDPVLSPSGGYQIGDLFPDREKFQGSVLGDKVAKANGKLVEQFVAIQQVNLSRIPEVYSWLEHSIVDADSSLLNSVDDAIAGSDLSTQMVVLEKTVADLKGNKQALEEAVALRDHLLHSLPHWIRILDGYSRWGDRDEDPSILSEDLMTAIESCEELVRCLSLSETIAAKNLEEEKKKVEEVKEVLNKTNEGLFRLKNTIERIKGLADNRESATGAYSRPFPDEARSFPLILNKSPTLSSGTERNSEASKEPEGRQRVLSLLSAKLKVKGALQIYQDLVEKDLRWGIRVRDEASARSTNVRQIYSRAMDVRRLAAAIGQYNGDCNAYQNDIDAFNALHRLHYLDLQRRRLVEAKWGDGRVEDQGNGEYLFISLAADISKVWRKEKENTQKYFDEKLQEDVFEKWDSDYEKRLRLARETVAGMAAFSRGEFAKQKDLGDTKRATLEVDGERAKWTASREGQASKLLFRGHWVDFAIQPADEGSRVAYDHKPSPITPKFKFELQLTKQKVLLALDRSGSMKDIDELVKEKVCEMIRELTEQGHEVGLMLFGVQNSECPKLEGISWTNHGSRVNTAVDARKRDSYSIASDDLIKLVNSSTPGWDTPLYHTILKSYALNAHVVLVVSDGLNEVAVIKGGRVASNELDYDDRDYDYGYKDLEQAFKSKHPPVFVLQCTSAASQDEGRIKKLQHVVERFVLESPQRIFDEFEKLFDSKAYLINKGKGDKTILMNGSNEFKPGEWTIRVRDQETTFALHPGSHLGLMVQFDPIDRRPVWNWTNESPDLSRFLTYSGPAKSPLELFVAASPAFISNDPKNPQVRVEMVLRQIGDSSTPRRSAVPPKYAVAKVKKKEGIEMLVSDWNLGQSFHPLLQFSFAADRPDEPWHVSDVWLLEIPPGSPLKKGGQHGPLTFKPSNGREVCVQVDHQSDNENWLVYSPEVQEVKREYIYKHGSLITSYHTWEIPSGKTDVLVYGVSEQDLQKLNSSHWKMPR